MIPIWIEGTFEAWPVGGWWPRPSPVSLVVGPPVVVTQELIDEWQLLGRDPYQAATQTIRDAIIALAPATKARVTVSKRAGEAG